MKIIKWIVGLFKPKNKVLKVGDKVKITCKKKNRRCNYLYDGKVGELIHICELEKNPWGNYVVILPEGFQDCFYADELSLAKEIPNSLTC